MGDASQQETEAGQASTAHNDRACPYVAGLGQDRGRDRVLTDTGARSWLQASALRAFGAFLGPLPRLILRGTILCVEVDVLIPMTEPVRVTTSTSRSHTVRTMAGSPFISSPARSIAAWASAEPSYAIKSTVISPFLRASVDELRDHADQVPASVR